MNEKILSVTGWLTVLAIILLVANLLTGCTANVISEDEWQNAVVVRESSGDGQGGYLQFLTGQGGAQSCGVATRGAAIEGLTVRYQGQQCEVSYDAR